jgi:hypothetical protein
MTRTKVKARPGKYLLSDVTYLGERVGEGVVPWSASETKTRRSKKAIDDMANLWNRHHVCDIREANEKADQHIHNMGWAIRM